MFSHTDARVNTSFKQAVFNGGFGDPTRSTYGQHTVNTAVNTRSTERSTRGFLIRFYSQTPSSGSPGGADSSLLYI